MEMKPNLIIFLVGGILVLASLFMVYATSGLMADVNGWNLQSYIRDYDDGILAAVAEYFVFGLFIFSIFAIGEAIYYMFKPENTKNALANMAFAGIANLIGAIIIIVEVGNLDFYNVGYGLYVAVAGAIIILVSAFLQYKETGLKLN